MPAWLAVKTTDPAPVKVSVLPLTVAGPVALKVSARPELDFAESISGDAPMATDAGSGANVIVCGALVTVSVTVALAAL